MVRTLLEACRAVGDSESASQVQATVQRLGLLAHIPMATTFAQGSKQQYENGMRGDGDVEAGLL